MIWICKWKAIQAFEGNYLKNLLKGNECFPWCKVRNAVLRNDNNNYTTTCNNSNNNDKITKSNIIFKHTKFSDTQKSLYMLECGCTSEMQRKSVD